MCKYHRASGASRPLAPPGRFPWTPPDTLRCALEPKPLHGIALGHHDALSVSQSSMLMCPSDETLGLLKKVLPHHAKLKLGNWRVACTIMLDWLE